MKLLFYYSLQANTHILHFLQKDEKKKLDWESQKKASLVYMFEDRTRFNFGNFLLMI